MLYVSRLRVNFPHVWLGFKIKPTTVRSIISHKCLEELGG